MPDISMCEGQNCPLKETCYRHTATPNEFRQSYFAEPPYDHKKGECKYYDEDKRSKHKISENEHIP